MSKALNIPWNSVKSIIKKWKEYGTCVNLPRTGRPHKLSDRARRRLVREATKTPMTTRKELQASATEMGETLHTRTVAQVLHQSKLYGRETHLKKTHIKYRLEFAISHVGDSMVKWKKVLWSDENKVELFSSVALFHKALIGEEPGQQFYTSKGVKLVRSEEHTSG